MFSQWLPECGGHGDISLLDFVPDELEDSGKPEISLCGAALVLKVEHSLHARGLVLIAFHNVRVHLICVDQLTHSLKVDEAAPFTVCAHCIRDFLICEEPLEPLFRKHAC